MSHDNPRDLISVETSPRFQEFANGFGITLAGYMHIRWPALVFIASGARRRRR